MATAQDQKLPVETQAEASAAPMFLLLSVANQKSSEEAKHGYTKYSLYAINSLRQNGHNSKLPDDREQIQFENKLLCYNLHFTVK